MKTRQTKITKQRLRILRKVMREKPMTQADIAELFGVHQTTASQLIRTLIKMRHARTSQKVAVKDDRCRAMSYVLTDYYLTTVKPSETEEPCAAEGPCEAQEYEPEVEAVASKPGLWQRFRCWVAGNPYAGARA